MTQPSDVQPPIALPRVDRRTAGATALVFVCLIFGGLLGHVWAVASGRLALVDTTPTWSGFLDGHVTAEIAAALSSAPVPAAAATLQRGLNWEVFSDLGPRVRPGCPGWLFLQDELQVHQSGAAHALQRADVLADIRQALALQGTTLLVLTIPDKSRIESAQLCGLPRAPQLDGRLDEWMTALQLRGVEMLDVTAALESVALQEGDERAFLRTDTHWAEAGAEAAAIQVTERIRALQVEVTPYQRYAVGQAAPAPWSGDLIRLAGLENWHGVRSLRRERVAVSSFELIEETETHEDDLAAALFGDAALPTVALIGTSYSNTSNFVGFLQAHLQTRIGAFAKDGGDFAGAARDYFASATFRDSPPTLLIWEMPERVLQAPLDEQGVGWPLE